MAGHVADFIREIAPRDLPEAVLHQAQRCLIDLTGIAFAGSQTAMSRLMRDHATEQFGSDRNAVRLLADGRRTSPVGAALAGSATIDSLDGHDGHHLTKGHTGAGVLPALLAFTDCDPAVGGAEFLTRLVLGYEIGTRAGMALHATAADYHSSGSWNALACAAVGARALQLDHDRVGEALGIAEYHGPRSQMMRCVDHPTMVKDGSAWGAAAGVSAAFLAAQGFTGAPAVTTIVDEVSAMWSDLGERWRILEQYFKPYPICRWAHPAVEATISTAREHALEPAEVRGIEVSTFHPATRLSIRIPGTTEQAQYSLPFAVALALVRSDVRPADLTGPALADPEVRRISELIRICEDPDLTGRFPQQRMARVRFTLADGRDLTSRLTGARGAAAEPLTDDELRAKTVGYARPVIGEARTTHLLRLVGQLPTARDLTPLLDALLDTTSS